ncbi:hypothetical protein [Marinimicrobium sp. C2-29]|uniref:hypothetical protein n=1 Tax=Marinimicrobium sp. C2-29 TaxID=3139825 RepID=UPI003139D8E8
MRWAVVLLVLSGCAVHSPEPGATREPVPSVALEEPTSADSATSTAPEAPPLLRLPPPPTDESLELETATPITIELPITDED